MTHDDYWVALQARHATKAIRQRRQSRWTRVDILACLTSWSAQEGRPPITPELQTCNQLPNYSTVVLLWGSIGAAWAALGWLYRPYGGRPPKAVGQGNRECLMCDAWFLSPEPRFTRVCEKCKRLDEWSETGDWMNSTAIIQAGGNVVDWWEET